MTAEAGQPGLQDQYLFECTERPQKTSQIVNVFAQVAVAVLPGRNLNPDSQYPLNTFQHGAILRVLNNKIIGNF
jgi:hypothetical protein